MFVIVDKLPEGKTEPRFYIGYMQGNFQWSPDRSLAREYSSYDTATKVAQSIRVFTPGQIVFVQREKENENAV
jgi:hypothetical protein